MSIRGIQAYRIAPVLQPLQAGQTRRAPLAFAEDIGGGGGGRPAPKFKAGDKAAYPAHGVVEVIGIEERNTEGGRRSFYTLQVLDTDHKIMVPVDSAQSAGLRPLINERDIHEVFALLRETPATVDRQVWIRRYNGFMNKIKTGSIFDIAEVLRDLYRLRNEKTLSFGERRMLETARNLIAKEIALARRQTEIQVRREIEAIFTPNP